MKSTGPLLIILVFGLLVAAVLVVTQTIASTISSVAGAYEEVQTTAIEQQATTDKWTLVSDFLNGLVGGASAAVI